MNYTAVIPPYKQHKFSAMKLYLWCRLRRFNLVIFALNIVIKDPFFITCNDILDFFALKKVLSLWICDFPDIWGLEETSSWLAFPKIFFQTVADCRLECLEVKWQFSSTFALTAFQRFFENVLIEVKCASWSGFISQWRTKLWKLASDFAVSNDTLAINTRNFLSCFRRGFVILKLSQHYISTMLFLFLYFHRFNYDMHLFINEIRMTDGGKL